MGVPQLRRPVPGVWGGVGELAWLAQTSLTFKRCAKT